MDNLVGLHFHSDSECLALSKYLFQEELTYEELVKRIKSELDVCCLRIEILNKALMYVGDKKDETT